MDDKSAGMENQIMTTSQPAAAAGSVGFLNQLLNNWNDSPHFCYSCSQKCECHRIDFLKKTESKGTENHIVTPGPGSYSAFDRLPDEVLLRILNYISPVNIDDFITLIALEMVSKRFRHFVINKQKIWVNVTELVIGFHPNLPKDQYLCHIGHASLELFLRRVTKITKIIINIKGGWACANMVGNRILPIIDRFAEKLHLKELSLYEYENDAEYVSVLVEKLMNNYNGAKQSLEILHIRTDDCLFNHTKSLEALHGCSSNLKTLSLKHCIDNSVDPAFLGSKICLGRQLDNLKSLQMLEITDYTPQGIHDISCIFPYIAVEHGYHPNVVVLQFPNNLQSLRFTNPKVQAHHFPNLTIYYLKEMLRCLITSSIREVEIHYCAHSDDLAQLPVLFEEGHHLTDFKLIFLPYLEFNKTHKIVELLENVIHTQEEDMMISVIFKHTDVDQAGKLAIVHSLLTGFDVPHTVEHDGIWEFNRGNLCINLKLEKVEDESMICHCQPPTSD